MNEAARLLRHARRRAGLTQRALAAQAGVPQPYVARIESSATDPSVSSLSRLLRACGTTLEALPGSGVGVDTAAMDALLATTPAERLARAVAAARGLASSGQAGKGVLDPARALRGLSEAGVSFVVIGGLAAALHGAPVVPDGIGICLDTARDNLERATAAFGVLGAVEPGSPDPVSEATLGGEYLRCDTDRGRLDVLNVPTGTIGYPDLVVGADAMDLGGFAVDVVAVDDLIRLQRAAARPKDRDQVAVLLALRDAITVAS